MIPLALRLKKKAHQEMAKVQDLVVETLFSTFPEAVMHGGTAIWRCYNGNRFSEDIDVYLPRNISKLDEVFDLLSRKGLVIEKKKIGENSLYSQLRLGNVSVRFEALFKKVDGQLREYETIEGNQITISTLTPEEFIGEKVQAYLKRRKIRDLYDVFFLIRKIENQERINKDLIALIHNYKEPIDEPDLKILIIEGLVPSSEKMFEYLRSLV